MRLVVATLSYALVLTSCGDPIVPKGTIDLLRSGNPATCVAGDVQATFRKLVTPKDEDVTAYTIAISDEALTAFDRGVYRAECRATIHIYGPGEEVVPPTAVAYTISPSSDDQNSFVVESHASSFEAVLRNAAQATRIDREALAQREAEEEALRAIVRPRWLIGRWVDDTAGSDACQSGSFWEFKGSGEFWRGSNSEGRWRLKGNLLTTVGSDGSLAGRLIDADQESFSIIDITEEAIKLRRCSTSEMRVDDSRLESSTEEEATVDDDVWWLNGASNR